MTKNPLPLQFWLFGQDARLGYLSRWGFQAVEGRLYRAGTWWLHPLGLKLNGLLYSRGDRAFYEVQEDCLPPDPGPESVRLNYLKAWPRMRESLRCYEEWLSQEAPGYRQRLLRICPPLLRPSRQHWRREFLDRDLASV